ncbi:MAG: hypothetical protein ACOX3K_02430 [Bacilli bacterium]
MNYYRQEDFVLIEKKVKNGVIINIILGVLIIGLFVLFCLLATYELHLVYQILSASLFSLFAIFQIYIIDTLYLDGYQLKKHYLVMFLSTAETYQGHVNKIGEIITVSNRISAREIEVTINDKIINVYLLKGFEPAFKKNDTLHLDLKNRFIFASRRENDE